MTEFENTTTEEMIIYLGTLPRAWLYINVRTSEYGYKRTSYSCQLESSSDDSKINLTNTGESLREAVEKTYIKVLDGEIGRAHV